MNTLSAEEVCVRAAMRSATLLHTCGLHLKIFARAQLLEWFAVCVLLLFVCLALGNPSYRGGFEHYRGALDVGAKVAAAPGLNSHARRAYGPAAEDELVPGAHLQAYFERPLDDPLRKGIVLGSELFEAAPILHSGDPHAERYHEDVLLHHPFVGYARYLGFLLVVEALLICWRIYKMRRHFHDPEESAAAATDDPDFHHFMAKHKELSNPVTRPLVLILNFLVDVEAVVRAAFLVILAYVALRVYYDFWVLVLLAYEVFSLMCHLLIVLAQTGRLREQYEYLASIAAGGGSGTKSKYT